MRTQRNKHFKTVEEAQSEVRDLLQETSNKARNVTYIIRCDNIHSDEEFKEFANGAFDGDIPSWAWAAHYADYCLYVGATTNLHNRFVEHCFDDHRGALFTGLFPPMALVAVSEFDSPSHVFNAENEMAKKAEGGFRKQYSIDNDEEVFVYRS